MPACARLPLLLALVLGFGCASPREDGSLEGVAVEPDVVYGHKAGLALTFDVYRPRDASGAAVLFMNSGGFESGRVRQCRETSDGTWAAVPADSLILEPQGFHYPGLAQFRFEDLLRDGFTVVDVRHGDGSRFPLGEIVGDVRRAVRFLRLHAGRFGIDPDRIGVWGCSSGGYLALLLGAGASPGDPGARDLVDRQGDQVAAVVAYYPPGYDWAGDARRFPELIANVPALQVSVDVLDSLSLRHYLSAGDPPTLVIYGTEDYPFIVEPSEAVGAALREKGAKVEVVTLPGVRHEFQGPDGYDPAAGERAMTELRRWFHSHLGQRRT